MIPKNNINYNKTQLLIFASLCMGVGIAGTPTDYSFLPKSGRLDVVGLAVRDQYASKAINFALTKSEEDGFQDFNRFTSDPSNLDEDFAAGLIALCKSPKTEKIDARIDILPEMKTFGKSFDASIRLLDSVEKKGKFSTSLNSLFKTNTLSDNSSLRAAQRKASTDLIDSLGENYKFSSLSVVKPKESINKALADIENGGHITNPLKLNGTRLEFGIDENQICCNQSRTLKAAQEKYLSLFNADKRTAITENHFRANDGAIPAVPNINTQFAGNVANPDVPNAPVDISIIANNQFANVNAVAINAGLTAAGPAFGAGSWWRDAGAAGQIDIPNVGTHVIANIAAGDDVILTTINNNAVHLVDANLGELKKRINGGKFTPLEMDLDINVDIVQNPKYLRKLVALNLENDKFFTPDMLKTLRGKKEDSIKIAETTPTNFNDSYQKIRNIAAELYSGCAKNSNILKNHYGIDLNDRAFWSLLVNAAFLYGKDGNGLLDKFKLVCHQITNPDSIPEANNPTNDLPNGRYNLLAIEVQEEFSLSISDLCDAMNGFAQNILKKQGDIDKPTASVFIRESGIPTVETGGNVPISPKSRESLLFGVMCDILGNGSGGISQNATKYLQNSLIVNLAKISKSPDAQEILGSALSIQGLPSRSEAAISKALELKLSRQGFDVKQILSAIKDAEEDNLDKIREDLKNAQTRGKQDIAAFDEKNPQEVKDRLKDLGLTLDQITSLYEGVKGSDGKFPQLDAPRYTACDAALKEAIAKAESAFANKSDHKEAKKLLDLLKSDFKAEKALSDDEKKFEAGKYFLGNVLPNGFNKITDVLELADKLKAAKEDASKIVEAKQEGHKDNVKQLLEELTRLLTSLEALGNALLTDKVGLDPASLEGKLQGTVQPTLKDIEVGKLIKDTQDKIDALKQASNVNSVAELVRKLNEEVAQTPAPGAQAGAPGAQAGAPGAGAGRAPAQTAVALPEVAKKEIETIEQEGDYDKNNVLKSAITKIKSNLGATLNKDEAKQVMKKVKSLGAYVPVSVKDPSKLGWWSAIFAKVACIKAGDDAKKAKESIEKAEGRIKNFFTGIIAQVFSWLPFFTGLGEENILVSEVVKALPQESTTTETPAASDTTPAPASNRA